MLLPVSRTALISGVAGQDGAYLVELLVKQGYQVHGFDVDRAALDRLHNDLSGRAEGAAVTLYLADVTDAPEMRDIVASVRPDEVYNLAAQTRVDASFADPVGTTNCIAIGTANLLEAVRRGPVRSRFYQASSSEMFGDARPPQRESTPFSPVSPYGCAKVFAHELVGTYRAAYGMHAVAGILFNHESVRRSEDFVSRKITRGVADIVTGRRSTLALGNLDAQRDWGHARDYVEAMWLIMQTPRPRDYVIATGQSHSVAEFAELAFSLVGLDWRAHVVSDPGLLRPTDPKVLVGDAGHARADLGWEAVTPLRQLVREMLASDLRACGADLGALAADVGATA